MLNIKRVLIDQKSVDAAILRKKSSDDSINSHNSTLSLSAKKKEIITIFRR